jgi:hypothetical protein
VAVRDHLKCQEVKDSSGKREFSAELDGLVVEPGCVVKLPAKLLCEASAVTELTPSLPTLESPGPAGKFLCYKVKCPKRSAVPFAARDRFGEHALEVKSSQLLCAPAFDSDLDDCNGPEDLLQPCGADASGVCFLRPESDGPRFDCVDQASCTGFCTADAQCASSEVCAGVIEASACCRPVP